MVETRFVFHGFSTPPGCVDVQLESILQYVDGYLGTTDHPDYTSALNGLQVGRDRDVSRVATAVDASEASIAAAVELGAQLLIVHHGLFWGGLRPVTGPLLRRMELLIRHEIALYACHLPLDSHPEVGNSALLARAIGVPPDHAFGSYKGTSVGWWGPTDAPIAIGELAERLAQAVGAVPHVIEGGPDRVSRVGVVTGAGGSFIEEAARVGLDALVTGEGAHHHHFDAVENGVHVLLGGHYATETFGVRALGDHLAERFMLEVRFIDQPTGL